MSERLDRIESAQEQIQSQLSILVQLLQTDRENSSDLTKLVESNAKAIQSQGNQSAANRDLSRQFRDEIRALTLVVRESHESSQVQEREIRMQAGEIQNLADSIQVLYARQPPNPQSTPKHPTKKAAHLLAAFLVRTYSIAKASALSITAFDNFIIYIYWDVPNVSVG